MNIEKLIPADCPIPPLYGTEDSPLESKIVWIKLTAPGFVFYLVEFSPAAPDGTPNIAFGYVCNQDAEWCSEWGYISIDELASIEFGGVAMVKRDPNWQPKPFGEIEMPARYSAGDSDDN